MKTVLVIGATGTVGSETVRALLERADVRVRVLVRDPSRLRFAGVEVVRGDLRDGAALDRALTGVAAAFYASPHEADEEALADTFVKACETRDVRIVFLGVHADGATRASRAVQRAVYALLFPHYRAKFRLSERVRRARVPAVILLATNFMQNDDLALDAIAEGRFPMPIGTKGLNRVDVRDIGDAAARALVDESVAPGAHPVIGPASVTGPECAAEWSRALGRPIAYAPEDFAEVATAKLQGKKQSDFVASHRLLAKLSIPTDVEALRRTSELLGRPPRSYADYVSSRSSSIGSSRTILRRAS